VAYIVVIDSEETVRSVIARILEFKGGYTVRATGEFTQALEWVREKLPDLVVTNVFLRGIAGHDAMRKLRSEFPELPVLMVSGLPDESVIRDWIGETRFDIFPKPFTCDHLLEKVRQMIRPSGPRNAKPDT
jgi:two-component system nitrogen regulation response regulator NtrX